MQNLTGDVCSQKWHIYELENIPYLNIGAKLYRCVLNIHIQQQNIQKQTNETLSLQGHFHTRYF